MCQLSQSVSAACLWVANLMRLRNLFLLSRLDCSSCLMDALGPDLLMFSYLFAAFSSYSLFLYFPLLYNMPTKPEPRMWPPLSFSTLTKEYASFVRNYQTFPHKSEEFTSLPFIFVGSVSLSCPPLFVTVFFLF